MKTVFSSDEIPHLWANKSVPHGRSASTLSFNGDALLSYQTEIARHITHKGKAAIIINDCSYSVTTSKHQSQLRRAIPSGVPVFHIGETDNYRSLSTVNWKMLFNHAKAESAKCLQKAAKARQSKDHHESQAAMWLERANEVAAFFGVKTRVSLEAIEQLRAKGEAARVKLDAQRKAREQREQAKQRAAYEAWKQGEHIEGESFSPSLFPVAFRIEGDELVSTLGVRVPVREARVAHAFACHRRATGWHRNGETMTIGHYQLDSVTPHGVVAGCHRISWQEMERIAPMLASA